jgi:VWFA-related protein
MATRLFRIAAVIVTLISPLPITAIARASGAHTQATPQGAATQESAAQSQPQSEQPATPAVPVFKTDTNLVMLQANVFDGRSDAVEQLPQTAFKVYEDGIEQKIALFEAIDVPVTVGLIIDNSSSMITRRSMVEAGMKAFAESSREGDELFTIVFNENVRHGLTVGPFTRSPDVVMASLARFPAGGRTALHDAVIEALAHIEQASNQKRVLVVLSDGEDNASHQSEANMLHRASRSQALIYTIHIGDLSSDNGNPRLLRRLATGSGGLAYQPRSEKDVVDAFAAVGRNTRRGYGIGYTPTNQALDGTYRRIRVTAAQTGKKLNVRVREGYTAEDADAAAR